MEFDLADEIYIFVSKDKKGLKFIGSSPSDEEQKFAGELPEGVFYSKRNLMSSVKWDEEVNEPNGTRILHYRDGDNNARTYMVSEEKFQKILETVLTAQIEGKNELKIDTRDKVREEEKSDINMEQPVAQKVEEEKGIQQPVVEENSENIEQSHIEEKSDGKKVNFTDGMRKDAQIYRAILNQYACLDIARDLSDEAIYDLMYTINWTGGEDYSRYYYEYKSAEKDDEKLKELKERYVSRTKKLLQKSGYDEQEIEDKISKGYADKISGLHCWAGGLQCMFEDFFGPKEKIEEYIKRLEEDMKEQDTEEREVSVSEVKDVAVKENVTSRNNVIKAMTSSEDKKKEEKTHNDE